MKENGTQMATIGYNWASQITSMTYDAFTETRTYSPQTLQLTQLITQQTSPSATILNMSYAYNVGRNNGQIAQSTDGVLGETVNYTYDPLKRLSTAQATNAAWGQTFTYDGFGNLTAAAGTGAAPSLALTIDPTTNRGFAAGSTTQYYDANGNAQGPNAATGNPYTYDIENRLMTGGYTYDPSGKRVLQETLSSGNITQLQIYFYSITGQRIATYKSVSNGSGGFNQSTSLNLFFGGKQIRVAGVTVATDRLGSVRANANGVQIQYWPYGQERTSTPNGQEKFGTYFRDDGYLDYADQRYYYAAAGRFWTPDPLGLGAANIKVPISWNRYEYVDDDPIDRSDSSGQCPFGECVRRGIQVAGGVVQIGAGIVGIGAALTAEVGSGGLATVGTALLAIGSTGAIVSGFTNIAAGISGSQRVAAAAEAVGTVTDPMGLGVTLVTGDVRKGALASAVSAQGAAVVGLIKAAENGSLVGASEWVVANAATSPLTSSFTAIATVATGLLNNSEQNSVTIYTAPIQVDAPSYSVPYDASPLPTTLDPSSFIGSYGGGQSVEYDDTGVDN